MVKEAQEEVTHKAVTWCELHDLVINPNTLICALDNLGYLRDIPEKRSDYCDCGSDDTHTIIVGTRDVCSECNRPRY